MRYLMIVKATEMSERGEFPPDAEKLFAEMAEFNNEMIAAGIMLDGAGLQPSSAGKRIAFKGRGNTTVTDGPFAETKELISGFWVIECKDMDEALSWARRVPFEDGEVELRPYHEPEAFEGLVSDEVMAQEKEWRDAQRERAPKAEA
ncbi:YciI family protein [Phenylobacterium sp. J367]|uniref:YciI family protein n=1 Tax=Phenylobacterium sp. J367 TaxID=2898435 RepID=UPI0021510892|nr:YciI family protein [Phenylobacterium sp. J367]MCR5877244.1 YciI family protein [Phenylobacterium sp. J367]